MSAHLNTLAGTIYTDFISFYLPEKTTDATANSIIKLIVVIAGAICVGLIFIIEHLGGVIQISGTFAGVTTGPLLGVFTMGMLFPSITTKGAFVGTIVSLATMSWIVIGNQVSILQGRLRYDFLPLRTDGCDGLNSTVAWNHTITTSAPLTCADEPLWIYKISFYWYTPIGASVSIAVGLLVSWISGEVNEKRYKKDLYSPVIHRFIHVEEYEMVDVKQSEKMLENDKPLSYEEVAKNGDC